MRLASLKIIFQSIDCTSEGMVLPTFWCRFYHREPLVGRGAVFIVGKSVS